MLRIADLIDSLNTNIARIIRWLALIMVLVQFSIVIGRYVFGVNSIAAQESVLYMHAALFMLAAGFTLLVDKHVRVDVFYAKATPKRQRQIDVFGHFFSFRTMTHLLSSGPAVFRSSCTSEFQRFFTNTPPVPRMWSTPAFAALYVSAPSPSVRFNCPVIFAAGSQCGSVLQLSSA